MAVTHISFVVENVTKLNNVTALRTDFKDNVIWEAERVAFFDNHIINADAPSYAKQDWQTVSKIQALQKYTKYDIAAKDSRGSSIPLLYLTEGVMHREYEAFQRKTGETLAVRWCKPYSPILL